jgi:hypothetical protein
MMHSRVMLSIFYHAFLCSLHKVHEDMEMQLASSKIINTIASQHITI